ncbi:MAG: type II secretion system F family protein [Deltaproteobacteria bacterium]|nr:type II secretion system F family protein [Deltaproteobacteria bacterium]
MEFLTEYSNYAYTIGLVGVFVGVCLAMSGIHYLVVKPVSRRRQLERRLKKTEKDRLAKIQILKTLQEDEKSLVITIVEKIAGVGKLANFQRDVFWKPTTFISLMGLLACGGFAAGSFLKGTLVGLALGAGLGLLPLLVVRFRKRKKARIFEKQMPECMELLARSMRAGHALPSAIELASHEINPPLGLEMKIVYEEQRLGLSLNMALRRMGERVDSQDLQFFITAVMLQSETGGNLAEILENIGFLIRERLKLKGKVKALTAEGRFSALILGLLPFVVFAAINIMNPGYINTLFNDPVGPKLIFAALANLGLGILWLRKIIQIKV